VPIISRFFGILVTINYREHDPPHFHAWYPGREAQTTGDTPKLVSKLIDPLE